MCFELYNLTQGDANLMRLSSSQVKQEEELHAGANGKLVDQRLGKCQTLSVRQGLYARLTSATATPPRQLLL